MDIPVVGLLRCFPFDTKLGKMLHEFLFSFVQQGKFLNNEGFKG